MQLVTDRGADITPQQAEGLEIHYVPLIINLSDKTYYGGEDITADEFYKLLMATDDMPSTSQPAPGDFSDLFLSLGKRDPDILCVTISSGLSGTHSSAKVGAQLALEENPDLNITIFDSMTLGGGLGWQVEAAARGIKAGQSLDAILANLEKIRDMTHTMFTLPDLKYLIHGGRISHIRGLLASTLNIKPIIGVSKEDGSYEQISRIRSFKRALKKLPDVVNDRLPGVQRFRVQVQHASDPETAEKLKKMMSERYDCEFLPPADIAPALGAHTGPGMIGLNVAPLDDYPDLP
jgi:DegV family protein with EDD domain